MSKRVLTKVKLSEKQLSMMAPVLSEIFSKSAGVSIITGVSGTVKEAVERYKKGEFKSTEGPSVDSHHGIKK